VFSFFFDSPDSCQGDSGGLLFTTAANGQATIHGTVVGGAGCASIYPGVNTWMSNCKQWINAVICTHSANPHAGCYTSPPATRAPTTKAPTRAPVTAAPAPRAPSPIEPVETPTEQPESKLAPRPIPAPITYPTARDPTGQPNSAPTADDSEPVPSPRAPVETPTERPESKQTPRPSTAPINYPTARDPTGQSNPAPAVVVSETVEITLGGMSQPLSQEQGAKFAAELQNLLANGSTVIYLGSQVVVGATRLRRHLEGGSTQSVRVYTEISGGTGSPGEAAVAKLSSNPSALVDQLRSADPVLSSVETLSPALLVQSPVPSPTTTTTTATALVVPVAQSASPRPTRSACSDAGPFP
jgi:Trypsin